MPNKLNPYINFTSGTKEALQFYKGVFGGTLTMMTYKEGGMTQDPAQADKIMHGMLIAENGMTLMAADVPDGMPFNTGSSISLSLSGEGEAELNGYWEKLSEGANITMPMGRAPWGDLFGMLTDKYGISWLVNVVAKKS